MIRCIRILPIHKSTGDKFRIAQPNNPRPNPQGMGYSPSISMMNSSDLQHHYDDFPITDGTGRESYLFEKFANIPGLNLIDNQMFPHCIVHSNLITKSNHPLPIEAMLDTGCSVGNYMSMSYYQRHPELQLYLVASSPEIVDLATHGVSTNVTLHIDIILEIIHHGEAIRCKIRIGVMDNLRYDLVIGLIVIASYFTDVMHNLLELHFQQYNLQHSSQQQQNKSIGSVPCGERDIDRDMALTNKVSY